MVDTTRRHSAVNSVPGPGDAGNVKVQVHTVTAGTTAAVAAGTSYTFGQIPSKARILASSRLYTECLSTLAATFNIGLSGSQITDDTDAIGSAFALNAVGENRVVSDIANVGKRAWEFVNGQSTDPGGLLTVTGLTVAQSLTTGASGDEMTLELNYIID
jgi:hypothetical protein